MKVANKQFGEIEFTQDMLIKFDDGIIGFENLKDYLIVNSGDELFLWLMSVDEPEIIFPLFGINALWDEYPQLQDSEPFGIVNLNKDPRKITVNLKAPVYVNLKEKKGIQKILDEDGFPIDYILFLEN